MTEEQSSARCSSNCLKCSRAFVMLGWHRQQKQKHREVQRKKMEESSWQSATADDRYASKQQQFHAPNR